jgi:Porin PorA
MRRTASPLSLVLLGVGVFLLALAPLLARYVEPRAERTPTDVDVTTVLTGTGEYFDTKTLRPVRDKPITITRRVLGDVAASERSGRAVWDVSTAIDTPDTLALRDPRRSYQWTLERWVTDRRTNAPVHCCGETPAFQGEAYLKFPFNVQKRGYLWWDNTLGATVRLEFKGTKKVAGYEGYRFTGSVNDTRTGTRQVPGRLVGLPKQSQVHAEEWYANKGIELVVERRTGRIMNARIAPRKTLRAPGADEAKVVLLDSAGLEFTRETQRAQVALAKEDSGRLRALGETAPIGAGAAGLLLAAAGVALVVRGRQRPNPQ